MISPASASVFPNWRKTGKTSLLTELRVQGIDRYDNIFKDTKEKHYELGTRVRLNTMTRINDRSTLYGQLETYMGMNGRDPYDINKYTYDKTETKASAPDTAMVSFI